MRMTRRNLFIYWAILLVLGLATGLYPYLPSGISVQTAQYAVLKDKTTQAESEALFGRPVEVISLPDGRTFVRWELWDGWLVMVFTADDRAMGAWPTAENWFERKRKQLKQALDW